MMMSLAGSNLQSQTSVLPGAKSLKTPLHGKSKKIIHTNSFINTILFHLINLITYSSSLC